MPRPTEPAPEQLDRSGESGTLVTATYYDDASQPVTVPDTPVEWTTHHPADMDAGVFVEWWELLAGYMTPAELAAWEAGQNPGPGPQLGLTGADVAAFMGQGDDAELVALADRHVAIVTELARAYTRGNGFDGAGEGDPLPDVAAVITMATARLVNNPEQNKREQYEDYQVTPTAFVGWSLVETLVLNRYRKRSS